MSQVETKFEVQTRSNDGALNFFPTVSEAADYTSFNPDVWKISFALPSGERLRLVKEDSGGWQITVASSATDGIFREFPTGEKNQ